MPGRLQEFREFREMMNARILAAKNLSINRFFTLDGNAYEDGALDARTKEFAGLAASMVLRCDDCIAYHTIRCKELGATDGQMMEAFNVGLIVGGSIVIPHLRRAVALLDEINAATPLGAGPGSESTSHRRAGLAANVRKPRSTRQSKQQPPGRPTDRRPGGPHEQSAESEDQ